MQETCKTTLEWHKREKEVGSTGQRFRQMEQHVFDSLGGKSKLEASEIWRLLLSVKVPVCHTGFTGLRQKHPETYAYNLKEHADRPSLSTYVSALLSTYTYVPTDLRM